MNKKNLSLIALSFIVLSVISASKTHAQSLETYTADAGDGISHIAKKANLNYMSETVWNEIAQANGFNNYTEYHLFVGDKVKVVKSGESKKPIPEAKQVQAEVRKSNVTDINSIINEAANKYGVRASLLKSLLNHESGLRADAVSPTGDYGIAQINLRSHPDISKAQAFDPYFAIMWAAANLKDKVSRFGEYDALRAYNCGEGGMKKKSCGVNYANNILNDAK